MYLIHFLRFRHILLKVKILVRVHSNHTWHFRGSTKKSRNIFWPFFNNKVLFWAIYKLEKANLQENEKCHMRRGSKKVSRIIWMASSLWEWATFLKIKQPLKKFLLQMWHRPVVKKRVPFFSGKDGNKLRWWTETNVSTLKMQSSVINSCVEGWLDWASIGVLIAVLP